ncbi:AraC family transcriptional regulator [Paenibacillus chibensis]|uniref:AraC family transcriptional regulator n=1 Tax=Paenibacillus chibensis TaxID=59846 RepID=UPI000FD7094B|nr:AraC family transcriptional regulator [Paenibacillus chibensis]MEC0372826.1 AraC family transcriptional regulator [Paenibacillus chibensis]
MTNLPYQERIDSVIRYIQENSSEKLTLDQLAAISHFSKYHFSRIFSATVGMTPVAYVNRERVRKSVQLLAESHLTMLEISSRCGFDSISAFHAAFKKHYGMSPGEMRRSIGQSSNFQADLSNNPEESASATHYNRNSTSSLFTRMWEQLIRIEAMSDVEVACVRHTGSYLDTYKAWDKLSQWAGERGLTPDRERYIGISLDDIRVVDELACRYDACVTIPEGFVKEGNEDVRFATLSGGCYAVYSYYDTIDKFFLAFQNVYAIWLPNSGYEADDRPCLEVCLNDPAKDPEGKCKVDLYVPVKKRGMV